MRPDKMTSVGGGRKAEATSQFPMVAATIDCGSLSIFRHDLRGCGGGGGGGGRGGGAAKMYRPFGLVRTITLRANKSSMIEKICSRCAGLFTERRVTRATPNPSQLDRRGSEPFWPPHTKRTPRPSLIGRGGSGASARPRHTVFSPLSASIRFKPAARDHRRHHRALVVFGIVSM